MDNPFSYLVDKVRESSVLSEPFEFLYIKNFLSSTDYDEIMSLKVINTRGDDFDDLHKNLTECGYTHQAHPGTFQTIKKYKKWRAKKVHYKKDVQGTRGADLCEGGGFAYRLRKEPKIIQDLTRVFKSKEMESAMRDKFNLLSEDLRMDVGLQKYTHGYEISPHPDTREKALTWMLNLNSDPNSCDQDYHTHFLELKTSYAYVKSIWESMPHLQRTWVPWSWCNTLFKQKDDNSITIFSPNNKSMHAVKAFYEDLEHQRTQIYGNYWYKSAKAKLTAVTYRDLDIDTSVKVGQKKFDTTFQKFYRTVHNKIF